MSDRREFVALVAVDVALGSAEAERLPITRDRVRHTLESERAKSYARATGFPDGFLERLPLAERTALVEDVRAKAIALRKAAGR